LRCGCLRCGCLRRGCLRRCVGLHCGCVGCVASCNKYLNNMNQFFVIIGLKKGTSVAGWPPPSSRADSHDVIPELQWRRKKLKANWFRTTE
jgi:hypothetical protein